VLENKPVRHNCPSITITNKRREKTSLLIVKRLIESAQSLPAVKTYTSSMHKSKQNFTVRKLQAT